MPILLLCDKLVEHFYRIGNSDDIWIPDRKIVKEVLQCICKIPTKSRKVVIYAISSNPGTKNPWLKGIHFCSNEGPHSVLVGDVSKKMIQEHIDEFLNDEGPFPT